MDCYHVVEDTIAIVEAADDESVDKQLRCFSLSLSRERERAQRTSVTVVTGSNIAQSVV